MFCAGDSLFTWFRFWGAGQLNRDDMLDGQDCILLEIVYVRMIVVFHVRYLLETAVMYCKHEVEFMPHKLSLE